MALHLARRKQRLPSNSSLIQFFSNYSSESSPKYGNAPGEKPSQSPSHSSSLSSSPFADIKLKLEQQAGQGSKPFVRSDTQPQNRGGSLQELAKNLAKFERRSTFPPPRNSSFPSRSGPPKSFAELYKENAGSNSEDRKTQEFNSHKAWENLKNLSAQSNKPGMYSGTLPRDNVVGGGENDTEFLRSYGEEELGEKLRMLRPGEGKEFSLQELNERLVKLRQVEEKEREAQSRSRKGDFVHLRNFVGNLKRDSANSQQNISIMSFLGDVPEYKLLPPKESLVETYFHPDNMSSAEKMKIELTNVREEFKMSESDCGSARVQVAQLTARIKHLSKALHKKDKHSRKGLMGMVQKRKKLLKYLRRTDWDSYCLVLSKLGLRDNPDYKF